MDVGRVWLSVLPTGNNPHIDYVLEIAVGLTTIDGDWIDIRSWLLPPFYRAKHAAIARAKRDSTVGPMYDASGLWDDLNEADMLGETSAESMILDYLMTLGLKKSMPLCSGYSPFERKFLSKHLPNLDAWFSYKNIDVSTLRELCQSLNPEVYSQRPHPQNLNRGVSDLQDTVEEYIFYKNNFLKVAE